MIYIIGFVCFFILGWLCGQSKWWYAIRRIWREAFQHEDND